MASINTMVKKVAGMVDTKDLTAWENKFVKSIVAQTANGDNTSSLTENQVDVLERIYERHFAD